MVNVEAGFLVQQMDLIVLKVLLVGEVELQLVVNQVSLFKITMTVMPVVALLVFVFVVMMEMMQDMKYKLVSDLFLLHDQMEKCWQ